MITRLYSYYDLPFDHDVCHLFEHLVVRSFLMKLQKHGYNRAFFGRLHGQTIDSTIFFDLGVYNSNIVQLFEHHLSSLGTFDDKIISQSIAHIEAEMESTISIISQGQLKQQLENLAQSIKGSSVNQSSMKNTLRIVHSPKDFQEVALILNLYDISPETQKAFLCLYPALLDIVRDAAIDKEVAYPTGESPLATDIDALGIAQRFVVKKGVDITAMEDASRKYLRKFDVLKYAELIDQYRNSFVTDPLYNTAPIRFFDQTGIQATREDIAQYVTAERMAEIINKMTLRVERIQGKLKKIEWSN